MEKKRLALGLDLSTQSLSAVVLDIDAQAKLLEYSLDFAEEARLNVFGIQKSDYILAPRTKGEADQPPEMFLASLDAMFSDLKGKVSLKDIVVINTSGQQHGHVYLTTNAPLIFNRLHNKNSKQKDLVSLLKESLAYDRAPIWMTYNTSEEAAFLRNTVGGKKRLIKLSGSDAQLRFTGIVIRRIARQFPKTYMGTGIIQLISSFVPAVLTGNSNVPIDFGNACGMSLMNYKRKQWSDLLLKAVSIGLPGGKAAFKSKLPHIVAPDTIVGKIASYFTHKYGFSPNCRIIASSGDNPQSKVLVNGDLLSLGSSLVNMVSTDGKTMDMSGAACAMYDGIGRPFVFGCRTNGTLVWDRLRAIYGLDKENYAPAEKALQQVPLGQNLVFWQPRQESFPPSGSFELVRIGDNNPNLGKDYAGIIESSLAAVYQHSKSFTVNNSEPLHVMGGAIGSQGTVRRISAIWKKPVLVMEKGDAALGAAIAGVSTFLKLEGREFDIEKFSKAVLARGSVIHPIPEDAAVFHRPRGYLDKFIVEEAKLLKKYPII